MIVEIRNAYKILAGKPLGNHSHRKPIMKDKIRMSHRILVGKLFRNHSGRSPRRKFVDNIQVDVEEMVWEVDETG
jgi:hypothetical protein